MKRIVLYLATNLAILSMIGVLLAVLGLLGARLSPDQWVPLLIAAAAVGFGGSLASLALSKWIAQRTLGVRVIVQPTTALERWLLDTARHQSARGRFRHCRVRRRRRARAVC